MGNNADTPDADLSHWQTRDGSHLLASEERETKERFFPPIPETSPLRARYEDVPLGADAMIYSFTVIHPHPKTGRAPFALIYADFPENVRVFGTYEGAERPKIGARVRAVVSRDADGTPRYTFAAV